MGFFADLFGDKNKKLKTELASEKAALKTCKDQLFAEIEERERYRAKLSSQETETERYKQDNVTLMSEIAKLQARMVSAEQDKDSAKAAVDRVRGDIQSMGFKLLQADDTIARLKAKVKGLGIAHKKLKNPSNTKKKLTKKR